MILNLRLSSSFYSQSELENLHSSILCILNDGDLSDMFHFLLRVSFNLCDLVCSLNSTTLVQAYFVRFGVVISVIDVSQILPYY